MNIGEKLKRICAVTAFLFTLSGCANVPESTESFFAMNTYMTFTVCGENSEQALRDAHNKIDELEKLWSVTDENSDIYAINHSGGTAVEVNGLTAELIDFSLDMAHRTGGALDPTIYPILTAWGFTTGENRIPSESEIAELKKNVGYNKVKSDNNRVTLENGMMLDLGAVGKGFAGDITAELLSEQGIESALLDIGGNIHALGSKPDGSDWQIGLRNPFDGGILGTLGISDAAVVTSGNYERYFIGDDGKKYGHIINPESGYPVENDLASVTIIGSEGKMCDALSTALFVMGYDKAVEYWRNDGSFDMILITDSGTVNVTEGIYEKFTLTSDYSGFMTFKIEK